MQLGTESKISNGQGYQIDLCVDLHVLLPYRTEYVIVNGLSWKRMLRCCRMDGLGHGSCGGVDLVSRSTSPVRSISCICLCCLIFNLF